MNSNQEKIKKILAYHSDIVKKFNSEKGSVFTSHTLDELQQILFSKDLVFDFNTIIKRVASGEKNITLSYIYTDKNDELVDALIKMLELSSVASQKIESEDGEKIITLFVEN